MDWSGLLKWSLQYNDGTTARSKLSESDVKFFQNAIQTAFSQMVDHHQLVQEAIPKLTSTDLREQFAAVSVIERCVDENPEVARNLQKLQAVQPLVLALVSPNVDLLVNLLNIFIFVLGNNPTIQDAALQYGAMQRLMHLCDHADAKVRAKAFGALAALIRNHSIAEQRFAHEGGVAILASVMAKTDGDEKVRAKAANLLGHLIPSVNVPYSHIAQHDVISKVAAVLEQPAVAMEPVDLGQFTARVSLKILVKYFQDMLVDKKRPFVTLGRALETRLASVKSITVNDRDELDARSDEIAYLEEAFSVACGRKKPEEVSELLG